MGSFTGYFQRKEGILRHRPEANRQLSHNGPSPQKMSRQTDQMGVFAERRSENSLTRQQNARRITERHFALMAGLPDPEELDGSYKDLGDKTLPIYEKRRELTNTIRDNRVTIVSGETGSGKTSQLYQYLLGEGYELIVVVVPRVSIANNVHDYAIDQLSAQRDVAFAEATVGVVHSERVTKDDKTKVIFATAASYVKMFPDIKKKYGDMPVAVIADEIHETNVQVEVAAAVTAHSLPQNDKWRLILSSATQNEENIQAAMSEVNGRIVPRVDVVGRPHNVEVIEESELDLMQAYLKYRELDGELRERVLAFRAGKQEIGDFLDSVYESLADKKNNNGKDRSGELIAMMFHAKITYAAFTAIMRDVPHGKQMLVGATPALQSGVTVPRTSLVVTDGQVKRNELDGEGTPGLMLRDASKAELTQQHGRAGRDIEGGLAVLTTASSATGEEYFLPFEERDNYPPPEIYNTNISGTVLDVSAIPQDFSDINNHLLNPVEERKILEAKEALFRLGALDENDVITELGKAMNMFPLRPELSRGLVEAMRGDYSLQTVVNVAAIASSLEAGGLAYFELGAGENWRDAIRESTIDDCIAQLDMFYATRKFYSGDSVDEAGLLEQDFDPKNTKRAHRQWDKIMKLMNISPHDIHLLPPSEEEEEDVRNLLLAGMVDYVYVMTGRDARSKASRYGSIYQSTAYTEREISSRSVMDRETDAHYVVGFPRRYPIVKKKKVNVEGQKKTELVKYVDIKHIVEHVWPLSEKGKKQLESYTTHLVKDHVIEPKLDKNGRLVEVIERRLGAIMFESRSQPARSRVSSEGQKLLFNESLSMQTSDVQRVLQKLLDDLKSLKERIPESELGNYFKDVAVPTRATLREWVQDASTDARSVGEVQAILRGRIYEENGLQLSTWIDEAAQQAILERSPGKIAGLNGKSFVLSYEKGVPIINRFKLDHFEDLPSHSSLNDGRKVRFRVFGDNGSVRGARVYTYEDLHVMKYGTPTK